MLTTTNRIRAIPAAPSFLTYKRAHSFVFATINALVLCLFVKHFSLFQLTAGGPSSSLRRSSCEVSLSEIIRVCIGIFTTTLRNKKNTVKFSPYFHGASLVIWLLLKLKEPISASYPFLLYGVRCFYSEFEFVSILLQTLIISLWWLFHSWSLGRPCSAVTF